MAGGLDFPRVARKNLGEDASSEGASKRLQGHFASLTSFSPLSAGKRFHLFHLLMATQGDSGERFRFIA